MSSTTIDRASPHRPPRVRHQAREAVTLMAFSAFTSLALAAALLILTNLPPLG